ncbi:hypothetical protein PAECIP111893_04177 [Paenibacillus plantiphilus]|uniref:ABC-2 type transport system permease protein n=1 Tax=Paenibacillus plantiphilus TaxID=2905650 RepID=A0ABM9CM67_9BACL|nr:ABC transporter permease [Paenibacillus plantiphilus]CAH1216803.1 hypothetical protein PAECIP111893_04177 [Paenibacillus plantiphilus]
MAARNSEGVGMEAAWTVEKLYRRRVLRYWREQWRVWRVALDWTVWIYIILPPLIIGGGLYLELWTKQPEWLVKLPQWIFELLPFIAVVAGRMRTFVEEADVLFLQQQQSWSRRIIIYSVFYTAGGLVPLCAALYALGAPSLIGIHGLGIGEASILCLFTIIWALIGAIWRNLIDGRYRGWRNGMWKLGSTFVLAVTYFSSTYLIGEKYGWLLLPICLGTAAAVVLTRMKLRVKGGFEVDVQQEHAARLAVTQFLLMNVIERKPSMKLNRPIVLRASKRLFKRFDGGTLLAEMSLKVMMRRLGLLRLYLGFAGVCLMSIVISPAILKLILLCLLPIPLFVWVQMHWRSVVEEDFVSQFQWKDSELPRSAEITRLWLVAPIVCLLGLTAGFQLWGAPGLLLALPAAVAWWGLNRLLYPIILFNKKKSQ